MRWLVAFVSVAMLLPSIADAEIVATCGASKGHAYYIPGPLVPPSDAGWQTDGISKGSFQLIRSGDDWDIVFTDASGGTLSAKGDGGEVLGVVTEAGDILVQIFYRVTIETYVFWLSKSKPEVSYSQAKFAAGIRKHSLMVAPCRKGG